MLSRLDAMQHPFILLNVNESHLSFFYFQGLTTYVLQGTYMNLKVTDKLSFPAASLNLFEIVSLLVLIPVIDQVGYPGLRRLGFHFTPLRRIGVGLAFCCWLSCFGGDH